MKLRIQIGTGNGKKGAVTIDTKDLPKKYTLCHGEVGLSAEKIEEEANDGKSLRFDS